MRTPTPEYRARRFSEESAARSARLTDAQLATSLDNAVMGLGQALDQWRFHGESGSSVQFALDALMGMWTEVENRGLPGS